MLHLVPVLGRPSGGPWQKGNVRAVGLIHAQPVDGIPHTTGDQPVTSGAEGIIR